MVPLSPSPKPKATSPTAVPSSPTFPTSGTQSTLAINPAPDTRRPKKRGAEKQEAGSQPKKKPKVSEVDTTEFRKRLGELGLLSRVTNLPSSKRSNFWRSSRVTQSPERVLSSLEMNKETKAKEVQEAKARAVQEAKEAKARAVQEAKEAKAKAEQEAKRG